MNEALSLSLYRTPDLVMLAGIEAQIYALDRTFSRTHAANLASVIS